MHTVKCEENKKTMKHLFLEGPIRSGKSTLIKSCLKEFKGSLGGFSCKRYRDGSGDIRAFGLTGPDDFDVDGLYDPAVCGDPENGVPAGLYVNSVRPGSPAEEAGIMAGDILTAADGVPLTAMRDLMRLLSREAPGTVKTFTLMRWSREGYEEVTAEATLQ